jgi:hypothetical protein
MEKDERPLCPRCGCPARNVIITTRVRCQLELDNSAGKVLSVRDRKRIPEDARFECGFRHEWTKEESLRRES